MILINDSPIDARDGERLIDVISRSGVELPQVCYHAQLGAIQTCDTCMVEIDDTGFPSFESKSVTANVPSREKLGKISVYRFSKLGSQL